MTRSCFPFRSSFSPLGVLAQVALLVLIAGGPQEARADRYDDVGPLGGKPKAVESVEGFLVRPTGSGFTGVHLDYPDHLTQQVGSPLPDESFSVLRGGLHRDQIDGAAGDFDGNGVEGKVLAYETSIEVGSFFLEKGVEIVISEEGTTRSVYIPLLAREDGGDVNVRQAILPLNTDPDPNRTRHYDRSIRVAVGQLDS